MSWMKSIILGARAKKSVKNRFEELIEPFSYKINAIWSNVFLYIFVFVLILAAIEDAIESLKRQCLTSCIVNFHQFMGYFLCICFCECRVFIVCTIVLAHACNINNNIKRHDSREKKSKKKWSIFILLHISTDFELIFDCRVVLSVTLYTLGQPGYRPFDVICV